MTAQTKTPGEPQPAKTERKTWKKKSPVEAVLAQISRLQDYVKKKKEELAKAEREYEKLEQVRKMLEKT